MTKEVAAGVTTCDSAIDALDRIKVECERIRHKLEVLEQELNGEPKPRWRFNKGDVK